MAKEKRFWKKRKEDKNVETEVDQKIPEVEKEEAFDSFFAEVMQKFPKKTADILMKTLDTTRGKAEELLGETRGKFGKVFEEFLAGVDEKTRRKAHQTIHFASLTSAIIGFSPIPFSDAFLLVPVQLTMMSRLHKVFGRSWSENLGKNLTRELVVVGLGKSAVGNLVKFIPVAGTVTGGMINATVAVAITETLGWVTVKMLNDGEDIFEEVMSFKGQFNTLFRALQHSKKVSGKKK
ncbi:hypothetical protein D920_00555 [Enterococcus faecalis 13-SD-W-01]|nr:hypothetical protein D920_00555 [Enterococcus faecalis 13-SD-W-01]